MLDDEAEPYTARQQVLERVAHADVPDNVEPAGGILPSTILTLFLLPVLAKYLPLNKRGRRHELDDFIQDENENGHGNGKGDELLEVRYGKGREARKPQE